MSSTGSVVYLANIFGGSQKLHNLKCGSAAAGIVGSNPAGGAVVCRDWCVLSGRGLCVGLITFGGALPSVVCLSVIVKSR